MSPTALIDKRMSSANDLIVALERGLITQMSVGMEVDPAGPPAREERDPDEQPQNRRPRHGLPAVPVVFCAAVFDRPDREPVDDLGVPVDELVARELVTRDLVRALAMELRRRGVERDRDAVAAGWIAGVADRVDEQRERVFGDRPPTALERGRALSNDLATSRIDQSGDTSEVSALTRAIESVTSA